jgi:hypothetical protein
MIDELVFLNCYLGDQGFSRLCRYGTAPRCSSYYRKEAAATGFGRTGRLGWQLQMQIRVQLLALVALIGALLPACDRTRVSSSPAAPYITPADPKLAAARVTPSEAIVVIPVGSRSSWHWYNASTQANHREYQWEVATVGGAFGFSLFKPAGKTPAEGQLSDLLNAGQASVWAGTDQKSGQMIQGAPIFVKAGKDNATVEITLFDGDERKRIFDSKPPTIEIVTRAPDANEQRYTIPVNYAN